jgi:hypothetical protein
MPCRNSNRGKPSKSVQPSPAKAPRVSGERGSAPTRLPALAISADLKAPEALAPKKAPQPPSSAPPREAAPAAEDRRIAEVGEIAAEPLPRGAEGGGGGEGDAAAVPPEPPSGGVGPPSSRVASPADLASIGTQVARALVYPSLARRPR